MKARNHKEFKRKEAFLKEKLDLDQDRLGLKLKELRFEYAVKLFSFLTDFLSSKK